VDELKEELATLRHRLAAEEEEAKRLREEVWCFVLDVSFLDQLYSLEHN
jgi:hypothetical protein